MNKVKIIGGPDRLGLANSLLGRKLAEFEQDVPGHPNNRTLFLKITTLSSKNLKSAFSFRGERHGSTGGFLGNVRGTYDPETKTGELEI